MFICSFRISLFFPVSAFYWYVFPLFTSSRDEGSIHASFMVLSTEHHVKWTNKHDIVSWQSRTKLFPVTWPIRNSLHTLDPHVSPVQSTDSSFLISCTTKRWNYSYTLQKKKKRNMWTNIIYFKNLTIPQDRIRRLIELMPRRVRAVLQANGGHNIYWLWSDIIWTLWTSLTPSWSINLSL
jgi:hypothetical protein